MVKGGEVRVVLDGVEGGVVALVALVFPYMDCWVVSFETGHTLRKGWQEARTKGITVAHFSPPTPDQMHVVLWRAGDFWIPISY